MQNKSSIFLILSLLSYQCHALDLERINSKIHREFPSVEHISIEQFNTKNPAEILLIDVREYEEYAVSHIPGARHLTDAKAIATLALQEKKAVVVYCSVGYRSSKMAQRLKKTGVENISNLEGSIFAWANASLPLVNQAGTTRAVHSYNQYWGKILNETVPGK